MEGLVLMAFDKGCGFVSKAVGEVFAFLAIGDGGVLVGIKPRSRLAIGASADITVKAVVLGVPFFIDDSVFDFYDSLAGEVPFSDEGSRIAKLFEFARIAGGVEGEEFC